LIYKSRTPLRCNAYTQLHLDLHFTQWINFKQKYNKKRNKERIHLVDVQIYHLILDPSLTHQGWIHRQSSWISNWMISQESTRTLWISNKKSLNSFFSNSIFFSLLKLISQIDFILEFCCRQLYPDNRSTTLDYTCHLH